MSLFKKNPNETAYVGEKKHWIDVIKNSGDGNLLIWRQPEEDFNTGSTLIVMPGEEAIFVKNGKIEQVFENGSYKLTTENYPVLSRLATAFSGGISGFNCVVYFVRKAVSSELFWGTPNPITVRDKLWGVQTTVGARGAAKVMIDNPAVFLERLIGNNKPFFTQEELNNYFGEELQGTIVSAISSFLNLWPGELIGLEAHMKEVAATIRPDIDEMLKGYGLKTASFAISGMSVDTAKYDTFDTMHMDQIAAQKKAQGEKIAKALNAEGDAEVFSILGENWNKLKSADILKTLAANTGAGGIASAGAGIGLGVATGSVFGSMAEQMLNDPWKKATTSSGGAVQRGDAASFQSSGRFVQEGAQTQTASQADDGKVDPMETLRRFKQLLDIGVMSQEEYEKEKSEIIEMMKKQTRF